MKSERYDVAIIGAGLGGLLCGSILASEGMKVCVLEKNKKTGGSLQIFAREKSIFNTGLNYTEGLSDGQILYKYFKFFGIHDKLKLKLMDVDGFERITFQGREYRFAQGEQLFTETLIKDFPEEAQAIEYYVQTLKKICNQFPLYNLDVPDDSVPDYNTLYGQSAVEFIQSVTSNKTLQNVLAGNNLLYAGVADKTPLYLHALITYTFISSAWRITDGSQHMATLIGKNITDAHGTILRDFEVSRLITSDGKIQCAESKDGRCIEAEHFISNIHPAGTLKLIEEGHFGPFYRKRIQNLENTIGMFTVYMVMKENSFPYMNHNHHYYEGDSVWTADKSFGDEWPQSFFLYTPSISRSDQFADGLIAMSYMQWDEIKQWEHTFIEQRGEDYIRFKQEKAEKLIDLVEKKFPGIRSNIKSYYTSTPLTWRDYTGTPNGSAYGILKDYNSPLKTLVMPKTRIPNLFFTGQNLNVHGILGVSIGALMTCGELLGLKYLMDKVREM